MRDRPYIAYAVDDTDDEISSAVQAILNARYQPEIGDRVRIVPGECRWHEQLGTRHDDQYQRLNGMTGTVEPKPRTRILSEPGHPHYVRFDACMLAGWEELTGGMFSPAELEPLS